MCGIIGYVGKNKAIPTIIKGLENLEYRGYDSAGIAYTVNNKIIINKERGRIINLKNKLDLNIQSDLGIGHTRWATHGAPCKKNSHPQRIGNITIVHNGIIENYMELKMKLIKDGIKFKSDTDTEVACALLYKIYNETNDIIKTIVEFQKKVKGSYAILMMIDKIDTIYAIKYRSPLIVGIKENETFLASDMPAIEEYTNKYTILEDSEFVSVNKNEINYFNSEGKTITKEINTFKSTTSSNDLGKYKHYMLKEIFEQPSIFKNNINILDKIPNLSKYKRILIVACGSAYHAGMIGKYIIEKYGKIEVNVEIASEFRYKELFLSSSDLVIAISQSGETADTLEAVNIAKKYNCDTLGIINVVSSSIARSCDYVIYTNAGNEIAVATTKAYSAQITILIFIAISLYNLKHENNKLNTEDINKVPNLMEKILLEKEKIDDIAKKIYKNNNIFFIGRNIDYALAMEGSLKLKEISYIPSQAYAAGELKHGTISLVDKNSIIIAIATNDLIFDKTISNIKETAARGAKIILLTNDVHKLDYDFCEEIIYVPTVNELFQPILNVIPLQLLSYEIANLRGCNIDKPKNLAKSVTVE